VREDGAVDGERRQAAGREDSAVDSDRWQAAGRFEG
jgi:hypothetical protein